MCCCVFFVFLYQGTHDFSLMQIDVVEPFTKIHRVAVQQPAVFKTAVQDVARVHTSVPVYGKALAPYTLYH